jgi:hypothetical protein
MLLIICVRCLKTIFRCCPTKMMMTMKNVKVLSSCFRKMMILKALSSCFRKKMNVKVPNSCHQKRKMMSAKERYRCCGLRYATATDKTV